MKKIRILQFPIANSRVGMTQYALTNWKWMDKDKFTCDFVTMSKHLDFEDEVLATGSRIFYISCYAEDNKAQFVKEFDEILNRGYDVVHLHTKQWKSFLMEEICKRHHVPKVIVHAHNTGIDTADPIKRSAEERLHESVKKKFNTELATDFWSCSRMAADFLFGEQIPQSRVKIMPNAIELESFKYMQDIRNEYRKRFDLENCYVIGHVGRFVYQKNHRFLLKVFHALLQIEENAKLILLGEGELLSEVRREVECMNIEDRVLFLGRREDVNNWYQAMDVFCLPSRFEGLPISMIEAQAAGLPCIGSMEITKEVVVTDHIVRLPFDVEMWREQLLGYRNIIREDDQMSLRNAGYDIQGQIKVIEKFYRGGVIRFNNIISQQVEVCA